MANTGAAKRARTNTLKRFFSEHNMRFAHILESGIEAVKKAVPLTDDEAIIVPFRMKALAMVRQLKVLLETIKEFDRIATRQPDYEFFHALPGAGPSLTPK